jgi:choline dehydrogenase-like flavoprotein
MILHYHNCFSSAGECSDNLQVIQNITVSKVLFEGSTAVGVEYVQGNSADPEILLAANEVILSAGVFGSSKILMVRPLICSSYYFVHYFITLLRTFLYIKSWCLSRHAPICLVTII